MCCCWIANVNMMLGDSLSPFCCNQSGWQRTRPIHYPRQDTLKHFGEHFKGKQTTIKSRFKKKKKGFYQSSTASVLPPLQADLTGWEFSQNHICPHAVPLVQASHLLISYSENSFPPFFFMRTVYYIQLLQWITLAVEDPEVQIKVKIKKLVL